MTTLHFDAIPQPLKDCRQWVAWRRQSRDGKLTKVPYQAGTNAKADVTKSQCWATFDQASEALVDGSYDGLGFVLTAADPFVGIDLDHCYDPKTHRIQPWALAIVDQIYSYTERSPSGTGLRIFVRGALPPGRRKKGPIEFYSEGRYLTVTGNHLANTPSTIEDREEILHLVHAASLGPSMRSGNRDRPSPPITTKEDMQLARMFTSKHGGKIKKLWDGDFSEYPSRSEADSALCFHLAYWFGRDPKRMDQLFRQSQLMRTKWDSGRGSSTYGAQVIDNACARTTSVAPPPDGAVLVSLADVAAEAVHWLWGSRIARGKVSLFIGPPGEGKSYLSLDMAARHSQGRPWPDAQSCPQGRSILLGAEDGLADTIRPRLELLKADLTKIHALTMVQEQQTQRGFDLSRDIAALRDKIRLTQATLVIIDPLAAYLGKTESYKDAEVRSVLAPLAKLAEEEGAAVVCVMHLNKSVAASVLNRASGSIAFVAAARTVFGVGSHPEDRERRLVLPIKSNIAAKPPILAFRIGADGLTWEANPVADISEERVFGAPPPSRGDQHEVREFLRDLLQAGTAVPVSEIFSDGRANGYTSRQLKRAADAEGIMKRKTGMKGGWTWQLGGVRF